MSRKPSGFSAWEGLQTLQTLTLSVTRWFFTEVSTLNEAASSHSKVL
jgi:hypothetical protein